jgi:prepilin-type N-terminal cleavage/methylation domain-containing protein
MRITKKGFTLVELLIVISLLGAIALIVISAINPIEQANRARDTRFKSDGGQLISAIDRYFAANSEFPWMTVSADTYDTDDSFGFVTAADEEVGICGVDCDTDGVILNNNELKSEFRNRDFITKSDKGDDQQILIGKETGSSSSVYACFIPLANSTKQTAVSDEKVYTLSTDGTRTKTTSCDGDAGDGRGVDWTTNLCYVCIPE